MTTSCFCTLVSHVSLVAPVLISLQKSSGVPCRQDCDQGLCVLNTPSARRTRSHFWLCIQTNCCEESAPGPFQRLPRIRVEEGAVMLTQVLTSGHNKPLLRPLPSGGSRRTKPNRWGRAKGIQSEAGLSGELRMYLLLFIWLAGQQLVRRSPGCRPSGSKVIPVL